MNIDVNVVKEHAIRLAVEHSKSNTRTRHFGCVVCDAESGEIILKTSNHPDHHAEANVLRLAERVCPDSRGSCGQKEGEFVCLSHHMPGIFAVGQTMCGLFDPHQIQLSFCC